MLKNLSLGLGTGTISVAVALVALLMLAGTAFADGSISVSTDTVANTGDEATVVVSAAAPSGSTLGGWLFEVSYDTAELGLPTCAPIAAGGTCTVDPDGARGLIRGTGFVDPGLTGTTDLFSITADAGVAAGACSDLAIDSVTSLSDGADGTEIANPTLGAGQICVATAATASPSPVVTPKVIVNTGGAPGSSSSSSITWLLAATGLAVVAGGAWVLARAGREN